MRKAVQENDQPSFGNASLLPTPWAKLKPGERSNKINAVPRLLHPPELNGHIAITDSSNRFPTTCSSTDQVGRRE